MVDALIRLLPSWPTVVTFVAAVWAFVQWRKSVQVNRAEMAERLLKRYLEDDVQEFFGVLDREADRWYEERFESADEGNIEFERKADAALLFFDRLCYLYMIGTISEYEISFFSYQITKLLNNDQAIQYFKFMRSHYNDSPFMNLVRYGAYKGIDKSPYNEVKVSWTCLRFLSFMPKFFDKRIPVAEKECKVKIGTLVRSDFLHAVQRVCLDGSKLGDLCDIAYSRMMFGIPYAVLAKQQDVDEKLNRRYYAFSFEINGELYRLCNHWHECNRENVVRWIVENGGGR